MFGWFAILYPYSVVPSLFGHNGPNKVTCLHNTTQSMYLNEKLLLPKALTNRIDYTCQSLIREKVGGFRHRQLPGLEAIAHCLADSR